MLKQLVLLSSIFTFLTACGGGGGSGGSNNTLPPTPTSSSSSSSTPDSSSSSSKTSSSNSSSSSSVNPCNNTGGTIFSECLNAYYGYIVGSQYQPTYLEYTESTADQQVQWSVVESNSTHDKVLDVNFADNSRQGQISLGYPDSNTVVRDLSEFQTGSLSFDIRVLNFGDSYNSQAGGSVFAARVDCVWPCSAHEVPIIVPTLDTWQHVEIPMSDLIDSGLDITHINISLVLVPQGSQKSLHIQLDNVQLSKGAPVVAGPKVIFKEDFNSKDIPEWRVTTIAGFPSSTSATTGYGFGTTLMIVWGGMFDTVSFETTLNKTIDVTNKKASFQIQCWNNSALNFSFQMAATDANGATGATQPSYGTELTTNHWNQVNAQFGSLFDVGFDPKHISKIGLQLTYFNSIPDATICQVDTIRITE